MPADNKDKVTILKLRKQKQNNVKTVGVTAYDYPQALMADNAGVDWILVGDSLGMTTLGYKSTIPVTMDDMLRSAKAVARGQVVHSPWVTCLTCHIKFLMKKQ